MAITVYDNLSQWGKQQVGTQITAETNSPGPYYGSSIFQFVCPNQNYPTDTDAGATRSRCEIIAHPPGAVNGNTEWYAFTLVSVSGTISTTDWFFRHQWHATQGPSGSQAMIIINNSGGGLNVRSYDANTGAQTNSRAKNAAGANLTWSHGTPYHIVQKIVWSTSSTTGRCEMWCNDVKFMDKNFATVYSNAQGKANVKFGMYCNDGTISSTVVTRMDGFRAGTANETYATMSADFPGGGGSGGGGSSSSVSLLTPAPDATLEGSVSWTADAEDTDGVASVAFRVDGTTVSTDTSAPYGGTWDSTTVSDGAHTLTARLTDSLGNTTTSGSVAVTVDNSVVTPPPDPVPSDFRYHKNVSLPKAGAKAVRSKSAFTGKITQGSQQEEEEEAGFGTTAILDSGTRANEGPPPSSSWGGIVTTGDGGLKIVSNEIVGDTSANNSSYWNATFAADQEAYVTVNNKGTTGTRFYVFARLTSVGTASPDGYCIRADISSGASDDTLRLYRMDNGSLTQIGSTATQELAVNDRIGIHCSGSTITGWHSTASGGWVQVITTTDSAYAATSRIGLYCRGGTHDFVNFGGGAI